MFLVTLQQKPTRNVSKSKDPLYIGPDQSFYNFKNYLDWVNLDLISKSSFLTLDTSGRLIVQYTLHTLYTTQKHKINVQKRIDPLCIGIVQSFYVLEN